MIPAIAIHLTTSEICAIGAAVRYQIPANVMLAVVEQENGKPYEWVQNRNGSYDVGTLQFNTVYLQDLRKYGIRAADVAQPGCYPYDLAAWRIHYQIQHGVGEFWTRVADYHSFTPRYNAIYRQQIQQKALKWQYWLQNYFPARTLHWTNEKFSFQPTFSIQQKIPIDLPAPITTKKIPHENLAAAQALTRVFKPSAFLLTGETYA